MDSQHPSSLMLMPEEGRICDEILRRPMKYPSSLHLNLTKREGREGEARRLVFRVTNKHDDTNNLYEEISILFIRRGEHDGFVPGITSRDVVKLVQVEMGAEQPLLDREKKLITGSLRRESDKANGEIYCDILKGEETVVVRSYREPICIGASTYPRYEQILIYLLPGLGTMIHKLLLKLKRWEQPEQHQPQPKQSEQRIMRRNPQPPDP